MALFKRRHKPDAVRHEEWDVKGTTFEGAPLLIRVNRSAVRHKSSHGIQIGVAVPLNDPVPGGFPSPREDRELEVVEQEIHSRANDRAILAAVLTTGTMREFVLYAADGHWIEQFHKDLDAAVPSHEIQVVAKADADWSVFESLAAD